MDSSRIIGIHQTRNQLGIESINCNNLNEAIGRLLYFQEEQKREGVAVLVSPSHIITPIVNVVSPQSKTFSAKDSFVFQTSLGEYIGIKELFFEKTFQYDDWNEASITDQQYCCYAVMLLERPILNIKHTGLISIVDYKDFFKVHSNKNLFIPAGKNDSTWTIDNYEQDKLAIVFDANSTTNQNQDNKKYIDFRIPTQVPVFVCDTENLGGLCLIGFAQQYNSTTKFQAWILSKDNFEDIHKWLNGHNASFTIDYGNNQYTNLYILLIQNFQEEEIFKNMKGYFFKISQFDTDQFSCLISFNMQQIELILRVSQNFYFLQQLLFQQKKTKNLIVYIFPNISPNINKQQINCFYKYFLIIFFIKNKIIQFNFNKIKKKETTIDSSRNFKSKELKDSKNTQAHNGKVLSLFKLEKYYAASCSEDKQIKVWNWRTGKLKKVFKTDRPCKAVFGIKEFLIGIEGNMMIVIDWKNKKVENISTHSCEISLVRPVKNKVDRIERIILIDINNRINLYRFDLRGRFFQFEKEIMQWDILDDKINSCFSYKDTHIIISTSQTGSVSIINWMTAKEEKRFITTEHHNSVENQIQQTGIICMMIHPQKMNYIIISCKDGRFGVWDAEKGDLVFKIAQLMTPVLTMDKQSSNQIVISDGKDYQLLSIQSLLQFQFKRYSSYHFNDINHVIYLDDEFFLTSDVTGRLRIWQLEQPYLLPDGMIGTKNHPVFNILQCPELNSLNNSLSSCGGYSSQQNERIIQKEQSHSYNQSEVQNMNQNQSKQIQRPNPIFVQSDSDFDRQNYDGQELSPQFSQKNQILENQECHQFDDQQNINEQDQTFSNSKFGNDSNIQNNSKNEKEEDIINNQLLPQILDYNLQQQNNIEQQNNIQNQESTPQFTSNNLQNQNILSSDQNIQSKIKMLNLEEAFNIKRKELEQQQHQYQFSGYNQPITSLYTKPQNYNGQFPNINQQQTLDGRLTNNQNQLIQSDRSNQSQFSIYQHSKKDIAEVNQDASQTDQFSESQFNKDIEKVQPEKTKEDQISFLNDNLNNTGQMQDIQRNQDEKDVQNNEYNNYNSVLSNNSEQYLTQIHTQLEYPQHSNIQNQNMINQSNQLSFQKNNNGNSYQLSNMISEVNQKLLQINQDSQNQIESQKKQNIPIINQQEVIQLRQELANLTQKICEFKQLNDSLDVNYQIVAKKFSLELEKSKIENQIKTELIDELEKQRKEVEQQKLINSKLDEELKISNQKYLAEVNKSQSILNELQITQQKNEELNKLIESFKSEQIINKTEKQNINLQNNKLTEENSQLIKELSNLVKEKQNLLNLNENLTKGNQSLTQDLNILTKEKVSLCNEIDELRLLNLNVKSELSNNIKLYTQLQQDFDLTKNELNSYKQSIEDINKQSQFTKEELIYQINQVINSEISEQALNKFKELIKQAALSSNELETILKNIQEQQINNLYNQIDEQQRENQRVQTQLSSLDCSNKNLFLDVDNLKKENERLKTDLRRSKDSLEHWIKQYSVLLDREKLQTKNIESKEELILLLKQEIEKLSSLYQQQLQKQLNQTASKPNTGADTIILEQCRKELLLDEWNSLLSLIENESMAQFSRIEQTNRKSEKYQLSSCLQNNLPALSNKLQQQSINPELISQNQNINLIKDTKQQQQSSEQILIANEFQLPQQKSTKSFSPLSQIPDNIPQEKKQVVQNQELSVKAPNNQNNLKQQNNNLEIETVDQQFIKNQPQKIIINNSISPQNQNYIKSQSPLSQTPKNAINEGLSLNNTQQNRNDQQIQIQGNQKYTDNNMTGFKSLYPSQSVNQQIDNGSLTQNNKLIRNNSGAAQKNYQSNTNLMTNNQYNISQNDEGQQVNKPNIHANPSFVQSSQQSQNTTYNIHNNFDTKYPQANQQETKIANQEIKKLNLNKQIDEKEYRSKSPQYINSSKPSFELPIQNQQNSIPLQNNIQEKSDRSISGLQNLKNMKKNISLTNVSLQPIATLNIANISPSSYNDQPSEFIRRQIEHQQHVQFIEKSSLDNFKQQRSLTPKPADKLENHYQSAATTTTTTTLKKENQLVDFKNDNNTIMKRRDTFNPEMYEDSGIVVQEYNKNYSSLSPYGRISTTPKITGVISNASYLSSLNADSHRKHISFTPTPSVKKQKIQEVLKMTYVKNEESDQLYQPQNKQLIQNQDQFNSHHRCKTEDGVTYNGQINLAQQQQQNISDKIQKGTSSKDEQKIQPITPTSQNKQFNLINQHQVSPITIKNQQINTGLSKQNSSNQQIITPQNIHYTHSQQNGQQQQQQQYQQYQQQNQQQQQIKYGQQNSKTQLSPMSSNNPSTLYSNSKQSQVNQDTAHKQLNFDYASQQIQFSHQTLSPNASPHSQGNFFSQKKPQMDQLIMTKNQSLGQPYEGINENNQKQNTVYQNNMNVIHSHSNNKLSYQQISGEKISQEEINENSQKKPLYRNYSINSQSSQKKME